MFEHYLLKKILQLKLKTKTLLNKENEAIRFLSIVGTLKIKCIDKVSLITKLSTGFKLLLKNKIITKSKKIGLWSRV